MRGLEPVARSLAAAAVVAVAVGVAWTHARADDDPAKTDTPPPVEVADPPKDAVKSIKGADAKKHAYFLASKKCQGRASGLPGCDIAGEYLIEKLTEWGWEPAGDGGTFKQKFRVRLLPFAGQPPPKDRPKEPTGETFNVAAVIPGTDEKIKHEHVVLSAHYDHTGIRSKKKIYLGADDNASGTSTLLEVAQAFTVKDAPRPRRTVMVLFVSGEERGLLGSKYFVEHPTVPLKDIVCDLNIDMVGRNDSKEMFVYGNASSPDLDSAHQKAALTSKLKFTAKSGSIFRRSDQYNFYLKDIPCLFWTSGLHKDYHTTKDEPKKLVYPKIQRAALHAYLTAWEIANRNERPSFVKMDEAGTAGRLGAILMMVQPADVPDIKVAKLKDDAGVALVGTVIDGLPAAEGKLKVGDFIIGVNGKALSDTDPVGAVENAADKAKSKISLRVLRGKKKLKLTVKF